MENQENRLFFALKNNRKSEIGYDFGYGIPLVHHWSDSNLIPVTLKNFQNFQFEVLRL